MGRGSRAKCPYRSVHCIASDERAHENARKARSAAVLYSQTQLHPSHGQFTAHPPSAGGREVVGRQEPTVQPNSPSDPEDKYHNEINSKSNIFLQLDEELT